MKHDFDAEKFILRGLNSDWAEQCTKLVKQSLGLDFSNALINEINIKFVNQNYSDSLAYVQSHTSDYVLTALDLVINMKYYSDIDSSSVDGWSESAGLYLDRTLAHEFTHAVLAANIKNFSSLGDDFNEGLAELVHGIDDYRYNKIINFTVRDIVNGNLDRDHYTNGYLTLRYLAKQGQSHYSFD